MARNKNKNLTPELRVVRTLDTVFDIGLIIVFLLLLLFTLYSTWDNQTVESAASPEQWQEFKPKGNDYGSFEELQRRNPEARAWLEIYGTNIDYPIMYSEKHDKYLTMNPLGEYSLTGSIFFDSGSAPDFSDLQTIIYGHHMEKELMFGSLDEFAKEDYFIEHQYGKLTYNKEEHGLEIWMLFRADAYDKEVYRTGIKDPSEEEKYLLLLQSKQEQIRSSCNVLPTDHIVLMSTCAGETTNGRTLLVAKILDWVPDNPFLKDSDGTGIDGLATWLGIPIYAWILLGVAVMGLVLLFLWGRRRKDDDEEEDNAAKASENDTASPGEGASVSDDS